MKQFFRLAATLISLSAPSAEIVLQWDAPAPGGVSPVGYYLHRVTAEAAVTNILTSVDLGLTLTNKLTLPAGVHQLAVSAYALSGTNKIRSDLSNIIQVDVPAAPVLRLKSVLQVSTNNSVWIPHTIMGEYLVGDLPEKAFWRVALSADLASSLASSGAVAAANNPPPLPP